VAQVITSRTTGRSKLHTLQYNVRVRLPKQMSLPFRRNTSKDGADVMSSGGRAFPSLGLQQQNSGNEQLGKRRPIKRRAMPVIKIENCD